MDNNLITDFMKVKIIKYEGNLNRTYMNSCIFTMEFTYYDTIFNKEHIRAKDFEHCLPIYKGINRIKANDVFVGNNRKAIITTKMSTFNNDAINLVLAYREYKTHKEHTLRIIGWPYKIEKNHTLKPKCTI